MDALRELPESTRFTLGSGYIHIRGGERKKEKSKTIGSYHKGTGANNFPLAPRRTTNSQPTTARERQWIRNTEHRRSPSKEKRDGQNMFRHPRKNTQRPRSLSRKGRNESQGQHDGGKNLNEEKDRMDTARERGRSPDDRRLPRTSSKRPPERE